MVDIQTVSIAVASASVTVAAIYYIWQIRYQTKLRQTDFIKRLYSTYGTKEFHKTLMEVHSPQFNNFEDFVKKYGPWLSEGPAQTAISVVGTYFTGIGTLLSRKIINIDFFYDIFGSTSVKVNWARSTALVATIA